MIYLVTAQTEINLEEHQHYEIIDINTALNILSKWDKAQFDIETTGLDPHIAKMISAQIGNREHDIQLVIDTSTVNISIFKEFLENTPLIGHNLKFDLQFLYTKGIVPTVVYDTMIIEQLRYLGYPVGGKPGGIRFGLNDLLERYLGVEMCKEIRTTIAKRGLDPDVILYAANDVKYLEDIMERQMLWCQQNECVKGARIENDFVPAIAYLEWSGIKLDEDKWQAKMAREEALMIQNKDILNKYIIDLAFGEFETLQQFTKVELQGDLFEGFDTEPKCTVNWGSSQQVIRVARILGFDTLYKGKHTVEAKHLKSQKGINDTFLKLYLYYTESAKVVSTYGQSYLDAVNPVTGGRIHTIFRQLGADTGRMSCGDSRNSNTDLAKLKKLPPSRVKYPQLQNLPSDAITRNAFVADEGNLIVTCDYSALESRLGADIYQEKSMINEFLHGSGDIHSLVAKACFPELDGIDVKDVRKLHPDLRNRAKPIGFSQQFKIINIFIPYIVW